MGIMGLTRVLKGIIGFIRDYRVYYGGFEFRV